MALAGDVTVRFDGKYARFENGLKNATKMNVNYSKRLYRYLLNLLGCVL